MRGWSLAVCSAALAIAAHGMAGGGTPDTALAVLLTMLVAWAGTSVADRRRGLFSVLASLGTAQLAMHLVLNYVIPSHVGHHAAPMDPAAMLATHVTATLLAGLLLAKADSVLGVVASAIRLLRGLVEVPAFPAVAAGIYVAPASPHHTGHMLRVVFKKVCTRRGPPVCS
jgi:hypothetical protein